MNPLAALKTMAVLFSLAGVPAKQTLTAVWQEAGEAPEQTKAEWRGSSDIFFGKNCRGFHQIDHRNEVHLKCCVSKRPSWNVEPFALVVTDTLECPPDRKPDEIIYIQPKRKSK